MVCSARNLVQQASAPLRCSLEINVHSGHGMLEELGDSRRPGADFHNRKIRPIEIRKQRDSSLVAQRGIEVLRADVEMRRRFQTFSRHGPLIGPNWQV